MQVVLDSQVTDIIRHAMLKGVCELVYMCSIILHSVLFYSGLYVTQPFALITILVGFRISFMQLK